MKNVSDKIVEKTKTDFKLNNFFFFRNRLVYEEMWKKSCIAGQATDDNNANSNFMMNT